MFGWKVALLYMGMGLMIAIFAGKPTATISGRIDLPLHVGLQTIAENAKRIPGFKLSRFMAAAMSVYARKLSR